MFNLFKKKKEERYTVIMCDNTLCKAWDVAVFTSKELAQEYCDFKNRTKIDPDLEWWVV
mgnify:CR=1 FL=1